MHQEQESKFHFPTEQGLQHNTVLALYIQSVGLPTLLPLL